ncbi:ABC transporter permease [Vagococcus fluvialis]|uniref:ABC transporter permease n=1 Tax=Vagococcus fluvialis TaxID=2738 RepID=UPI0020333CA2|nr:ABC transporter permease [Vagococcus fluvialis]MCM2139861.1 ABC transporter permease [Vagococcus fluvialis]
MNKTMIIAKDVYKRNVMSFSFFSMVFMPIIMMLAIGIFSYFVMKPQETPTIAFISENQEIKQFLKNENSNFVIDDSIVNQNDVNDKLLSGEITGYVEDKNNNFTFVSSKVDNNLNNSIQTSLNNYKIITIAENSNIPKELVDEMNNNIILNTKLVNIKNNEITSDEQKNNVAQFISVAMCILIFLFIMNYSAIIGHEISSEKGSRIMEVILSSTTATSHLTGKLLGILLMCLTQISIYISIGTIGIIFMKDSLIFQTLFNNVSLSDNTKYVIFINLIYFCFGVIAFSLLTSILSSLVSRTEDISKVLQPITFIGMGGFYLGIILAQNNPSHIAIKITSYIPFLSNFIMPFRLASNAVNPVNIVISLIIYLIFIILLFIFTFKIYKNNVLMYKDVNNLFITLISSIKKNKHLKNNKLLTE